MHFSSRCELGGAGVARELLASGADPMTANNAGEQPLYIAALKGHAAAVGALLDHFTAAGRLWHVRGCYFAS